MNRRIRVGAGALVLVPIGLLLRFLPLGLVADLAGGVLYAALIYLLVAFLVPRCRPFSVALWAGTWCFAVELLQLTGLPAALAQLFPLSRLVFGTGFAALDLLAYVSGVLVTCLIDRRHDPHPAAGGPVDPRRVEDRSAEDFPGVSS